MDIINCTECGKVCMVTPIRRCPSCQQIILQYEEKVFEHVECQQNATLDAIHAATNVPRHIIMQLIKAGRLKPCSIGYPYESCQELIAIGRLCARCTENVTGLESSTRSPVSPKLSLDANKSYAPYRPESGPY